MPLDTMPYRLVYGKSFHLLVNIKHKAYWAIKIANLNLKVVGRKRKLQLNELEEWRQMAYENNRLYKERVKHLYDTHIRCPKQFKERDHVLLYNSRLKLFLGKLRSRWSDPFTIMKLLRYGAVEVSHIEKGLFKVNGQRLKLYHGEIDLSEGEIPLGYVTN